MIKSISTFMKWILVVLVLLKCNAINGEPFEVYWNSPTIQCDKKGIDFTKALSQFNIITNDRDQFRGNSIALLYDPGSFPALIEQKPNKTLFYRNGGLPQFGNLTVHLEKLAQDINKQVPKDFSGIGVIDFESWRPVFRQNYGALTPYHDLSIADVKQRHPDWTDAQIKTEATRIFEETGRTFVEETIKHAKVLRPKATWGYYAYPYCFNMVLQTTVDCPEQVKKENDNISWLFQETDGYFPSLYMAKKALSAQDKYNMIEGRLLEARRLGSNYHNGSPVILPYFWYRYNDVNEYFSNEDLYNSLAAIKSSGANGVILWGSSDDVNTEEKCTHLLNYLQQSLGPALQKLNLNQ